MYLQKNKWQVCCCIALGLTGHLAAQTNDVTSVSGASYAPIVAPGSIVSAWGSGFNATTVAANTTTSGAQMLQLPQTLGSVSLSLKDTLAQTTAPLLYMVSPGQVNYVIEKAALGPATLTVVSGNSSPKTGAVQISNVAPAIYTADSSGSGVPAGSVYRVSQSNAVALDNTFQSGGSTYSPKPFSVSGSDKVFLVLYGTGIRNRSLNPAKATIGDVVVQVPYAGPQSNYPGFDQINVGPLPASLAGTGATDFVLYVDGVPSNTVRIAIQ